MGVDFAEVLLNSEFSPLAKGGPTFQNVIISTINGAVSPAVGRYDYISIYKFGYDLLSLPDSDLLRSFTILRQCGAQGFRFLAPDKNATVDSEVIIESIDSGNLVYKLVQNYADDYNTYQRRIIKPYEVNLEFIGITPTLVPITMLTETSEGIPLTGQGIYDIALDPIEFDFTTGIAIFPQEVADAVDGQRLQWHGGFHLPMIFMDGESLAEYDTTYNQHNDIYIRELLPVALGIT